MARQTPSTIASAITSEIPDNTSGQVSPADVRSNMDDVLDLYRSETQSIDATGIAGAALTLDWTAGAHAQITCGASTDITSWDLSSWPAEQESMLLEIIDGGSAAGITFSDGANNFEFPGGSSPSLTASGTDWALLVKNGTSIQWYTIADVK